MSVLNEATRQGCGLCFATNTSRTFQSRPRSSTSHPVEPWGDHDASHRRRRPVRHLSDAVQRGTCWLMPCSGRSRTASEWRVLSLTTASICPVVTALALSWLPSGRRRVTTLLIEDIHYLYTAITLCMRSRIVYFPAGAHLGPTHNCDARRCSRRPRCTNPFGCSGSPQSHLHLVAIARPPGFRGHFRTHWFRPWAPQWRCATHRQRATAARKTVDT